MAEPDENDVLPTQAWSGPNGEATAPVAPVAPLSDSAIDGMLGARPPRRSLAWNPPTAEELQAHLPQYEIRTLLGCGGMGAVYQGWQRSLDRFVAIKILPPGLTGGNGDFAVRFRREAKAMARLKHPGIIPVHDAGETPDGLLYFVMDYVEGTDLQKLIVAQGRLPEERALAIATRVLDALAYAHEHGIIHRDIKPANIMIDDEGHVQVADFGLARSLSGETSMLTGSHVAMGTPDFMAPESRLGAAQVDHRADLYAVGVMLYQMLTGKLPHGRFEALSQLVPSLDKRLDAIVNRALQPEPEKRYASAKELHTALDPVLSRLTAKHPPAGAGRIKIPWLRYFGFAVLIIALASAALFLLPSRPKTGNAPANNAHGTPMESEAYRLWDSPATVPNREGIRWQDDALRLDSTVVTSSDVPDSRGSYVPEKRGTYVPDSRDVFFRAKVRMNPDQISAHITIRVHRDKQDGKTRGYAWGAVMNAARFDLVTYVDDERRVLASWPFPREYGADEWIQFGLRAVGDDLTAYVDGQPLGVVHDHSQPEAGHAMLWATKAGFFRDIVYVPLDKAAGGSRLSSIEPGAFRLWDTLEKLPRGSGIHWEGNALQLDHAAPVAVGLSHDALLRASIRPNVGDVGSFLAVRVRYLPFGGKDAYCVAPDFKTKTIKLFSLHKDIEGPSLKEWSLPRTYGPDEWVRLELRAIGDALTVSVDGEALGTVHDSAHPEAGGVTIYSGAHGSFRDIVYLPLDKPPGDSADGAIKLWDAPGNIALSPDHIQWVDNSLKLDDASLRPVGWSRDALIRASIRANADASAPGLAIRYRFLASGGEGYNLSVDFKANTLKLYSGHKGEGGLPLKTWPLPRAYRPDEWGTFEVRAVGDAITVSVDGQPLGTVRDGSQSEPGGVSVCATANGYFRDIVYVPLDKVGDGNRAGPAISATPDGATGK